MDRNREERRGSAPRRKVWKEHKGWGTRSGYPDNIWRNYGVHERAHGPPIASPGPLATLKTMTRVDDEDSDDHGAADGLAEDFATSVGDSQLPEAAETSGLTVWDTANVKFAAKRRRDGWYHSRRNPHTSHRLMQRRTVHPTQRSPSPFSLGALSGISDLVLDCVSYDTDASHLYEGFPTEVTSLSHFGREHDFENDSFELDWSSDADLVEDDWEDLYDDLDDFDDFAVQARARPTYAQMTKVEVT